MLATSGKNGWLENRQFNSMIFPHSNAYFYRIRRMAMYNAYLRDPESISDLKPIWVV